MIPPSDFASLAARFQRFGALDQARQLYRQAVELQPDDAELWLCLGRVCRAAGYDDEALDSFRRAVELRPDDPERHNDLGIALMRLGQLDEAADSYRTALRLRSDYPEAINNLGNALMALGDLESAVTCYRQALACRHGYSTAYCNLGNALIALGEYGEAVDCYQQAVQLRPDFAQAWLSMGRALRGIGKSGDAIACYEQAAHLQSNDPELLGELGIALMQSGDLGNAVALHEQSLHLRPVCAEAYSNLGLALLGQGRVDEARLSFEQALYLRPDLPEVHNNLGLALLNEGRAQEAIPNFEHALELRTEMADARNNLGLALEALGKSDDALASFEGAVRERSAPSRCAHQPRQCLQGPSATGGRDCRLSEGTVPESGQCPGPQQPAARDAVPTRRGFSGHPARGTMLRPAARRFACRCRRASSRQQLCGRRLRIGYVSPDFREHPIAYFLEPILSAHDHGQFEIACFADVPNCDDTMRRLESYADQWHSLTGLSDAQVAEVIRKEGIDILVDLAGHTGGNRLPMFARKPAPIQVSYLGYLGTTGVAAMDYYITDAHADPPGVADTHYVERLIRLPDCAFCYRPGPAPAVSSELPAGQSGRVTFGCLNNPAKVSDEVLAVWSRVLATVPGSRLLLRTSTGRDGEERVRDILTWGGSPRSGCLLPVRRRPGSTTSSFTIRWTLAWIRFRTTV